MKMNPETFLIDYFGKLETLDPKDAEAEFNKNVITCDEKKLFVITFFSQVFVFQIFDLDDKWCAKCDEGKCNCYTNDYKFVRTTKIGFPKGIETNSKCYKQCFSGTYNLFFVQYIGKKLISHALRFNRDFQSNERVITHLIYEKYWIFKQIQIMPAELIKNIISLISDLFRFRIVTICKTSSGEIYGIVSYEDITIMEYKYIIKTFGFSVRELMFNDKKLDDNNTLNYYGIKNGSILNLINKC